MNNEIDQEELLSNLPEGKCDCEEAPTARFTKSDIKICLHCLKLC
jgi:hypothetical protein